MAEEEEVTMEVEAVRAVYEDDCVVLQSYPPHLHVHIKPRTADITSQQFVEALIGIQASIQYPNVPPCISLINSKGLDEQRKRHLISSIQDKACELSSCLMLVALCEEAVERLSAMNHPEGDCPLCLYPLVPEDDPSKALPFMKLMSCFHCFHCECIIRWWKWLQTEKEANAKTSSPAAVYPSRDRGNQEGMLKSEKESMGSCPMCRKVFHSKDFEHVLNLVGLHSSQAIHSSDEYEVDDNEEVLQSDSENARRKKYEDILKLQEENSGLIEPKKNLVVLPGMYLPQPVVPPTPTPAPAPTPALPKVSRAQHRKKPVSAKTPEETNGNTSSSRAAGPSANRRSYPKKQNGQNPRKPVTQWVRKDDSR